MIASLVEIQSLGESSMLKICVSLLAVAGLVAAADSARSADFAVPPPDLRPASYDWSGFHLGGWLGAMCIDTAYLPEASDDPELAGCRLAGGALGGYSYQFGSNLVVGLEGDFGWGGDIAENSLDEVRYAVDNIATLRARLGWAFDDTLLYATGGAVWAEGHLSGVFGGIDGDDTHWHKGWTAGIGMEHAISESFRFRLEYLYASLDEREYEVTCGCTIEAGLDNLHIARAVSGDSAVAMATANPSPIDAFLHFVCELREST
jgi:outer membrane immunogenic protein